MKPFIRVTEMMQDGAQWERLGNGDGFEIILTSAFAELRKAYRGDPKGWRELLKKLKEYRLDFEHGEYGSCRTYIASGQFASLVHICETIGRHKLCVREQLDAGRCDDQIHRMDLIHYFLEIGGLDRYIKSPLHYGLIKIPIPFTGTFNRFMFMEMIDNGVTMFDIIEEPRNEGLRDTIISLFGAKFGFTSLEDQEYKLMQDQVREQYRVLRAEIENAYTVIKKRLQHATEILKNTPPEEAYRLAQLEYDKLKAFKGVTFSQLFTDFFQRNVLITLNDTPVGGSQFTFWIIDQ